MISFIVPAYNEELLIGRALSGIHVAARGLSLPYEIIVVDDGSTDRTATLAEACGARVVTLHHRQIARVRNAGACAAVGDILVFVDADTVITASTLCATLDALGKGAVGGGARLRLEGSIPWHGWVLLWLVQAGMRLGRLAAGCYVFCTREAFAAVGGFDERLFATEEIAFSRALARQGRVVILRETVESSGRKLRTFSGWEILRLLSAVAFQGPGALRRRDGLELWYGQRRIDPEPDGSRSGFHGPNQQEAE
jgi:cellulose synthase/poly-beta-1,6-N-acetylglucosamine synthase-like glycosyltransferase